MSANIIWAKGLQVEGDGKDLASYSVGSAKGSLVEGDVKDHIWRYERLPIRIH